MKSFQIIRILPAALPSAYTYRRLCLVPLLLMGVDLRAQLIVGPESLYVAIPQGEVVERVVELKNGREEVLSYCLNFNRPIPLEAEDLPLPVEVSACGEYGEILYRVDREDLYEIEAGNAWPPYGIASTPNGRIFAAASHSGYEGLTVELTPDLIPVRFFEHPTTTENYPFPTTVGIAYMPETGTLWWLGIERCTSHGCLGADRAILMEGTLDGEPTGRQIDLPIAEEAPGSWDSGYPIGADYDPVTKRFYFIDHPNHTVWAVDTLGNVIPGYPAGQDAYPGAYIGRGLDVHNVWGSGAAGIQIEAGVVTDVSTGGISAVIAFDGEGNSLGIETPVPCIYGGNPYCTRLGSNPHRSWRDPNGLMYMNISNADVKSVVAIRPHPLPPSWLSVELWEGELAPSESREVTLTFRSGAHEVGTYTSALQAFDAATGEAVEVPVTLEVLPGTATEGDAPADGPWQMLAPYPNPSRGVVTVPLEVERAAEARVSVVDVLGREVAVLHDGPLTPGTHELTLGAGLPAGLYVVRTVGAGLTTSRRVAVVR